jgi:hypothetical protein
MDIPFGFIIGIPVFFTIFILLVSFGLICSLISEVFRPPSPPQLTEGEAEKWEEENWWRKGLD